MRADGARAARTLRLKMSRSMKTHSKKKLTIEELRAVATPPPDVHDDTL